PAGENVHPNGCGPSQLDSDGDGVSDAVDQCPNTPAGQPVDATGCSLGDPDGDSDGVSDSLDQCPGTPTGEQVFSDGCAASQLDSDGDGVANTVDICPGTPIGEAVDQNGCTATDTTQLPPDPEQVATPVEATTVTTIGNSTAFLYSGSNPIQTGVATGTIDPEQAAVTRGMVKDRYGNPVVGVKVSIAGKPEFGQTLSRTDGEFDMAVNGGGPLTVVYEKSGYLTVHRIVEVPWQDYAVLPDVVMTPLDTKVTTVQMGDSSVQVAQGSNVMDQDGERQATLMFPSGTAATMVLPDGSTQTLSSLAVRATEFTIGPQGPDAMPAELPPYSAYTYAAELSVDEAIAAGASTVLFDRVVPFYVDNFLNFPVGVDVPVGYYDRQKIAWVPSDNGRIIEILGVDANGYAEVDVDGTGAAADAATLQTLGITQQEREQLAILYTPGKTLWRAPLTHFTPVDCNWGENGQAILDARLPARNLPSPETEKKTSQTDPDCRGGSIIECQNQVIRERVPIVGTGFNLNYRSDRVTGRTSNYKIDIPVTDATVAPELIRIDVKVTVAGRLYEQSLAPVPNQNYEFFWDGMDVYGRIIQGQQRASISIEYVYNSDYQLPAGYPIGERLFNAFFGVVEFPNVSIFTSPTRDETRFVWRRDEYVGMLDANVQGLGRWTIDVQHAYDPIGKTLFLGTG
ncbi:MAG: thrombospondin type 3 repeat-containing protein, partial [Gammaproteobacteria bacterium]|nr:thrombospondin type 3 repeat-containing protein [Gammaproteobacteria bacterium]